MVAQPLVLELIYFRINDMLSEIMMTIIAVVDEGSIFSFVILESLLIFFCSQDKFFFYLCINQLSIDSLLRIMFIIYVLWLIAMYC